MVAVALATLPVRVTAQAGTWRIASGVRAPWVTTPGQTLANAALRGSTLEFSRGRVSGPAPLACSGAAYQFILTPADGLFQGSLPAPAEAAARSLGLSRLPVMTLSVNCESGLFDYHFVAVDGLLVALDNVIWTLTREALPRSPDAVVQSFLIEHMTNDMGFTPDAVQRKRRFLTADLGTQIASYFARPKPADEPPPINGDPFTNTQEYPDRFTIEAPETAGASARVRVLFRIGTRERPVEFLLRRVDEQWRIDDLRYEDGATFREILSGRF